MNDFLKQIELNDDIAIIGHINPDGDCVGACLGLYNYILDNYSHKKVTVFLQEIVQKFQFLNGAKQVCSVPNDHVYDLAISLDCGDRNRHGEFYDIFGRAKYTMCIDHHESNTGFGNYFCCEPNASSACEVLYKHLENDKINLETATCLYLGIVHDTGVFKYSSTSEETLTIAGKLLTKGVDSQEIIDDTFFKVSYNQNLLAANTILNSKLYFDGKVIVSLITTEIFEKFNCTKSDTDGIVDKLRITDGVEVAIFAYQKGEDYYKFSLRSVKYVDVNKIACEIGGGGHIRAAGCEAHGNFEEALDKILMMIKEQL